MGCFLGEIFLDKILVDSCHGESESSYTTAHAHPKMSPADLLQWCWNTWNIFLCLRVSKAAARITLSTNRLWIMNSLPWCESHGRVLTVCSWVPTTIWFLGLVWIYHLQADCLALAGAISRPFATGLANVNLVISNVSTEGKWHEVLLRIRFEQGANIFSCNIWGQIRENEFLPTVNPHLNLLYVHKTPFLNFRFEFRGCSWDFLVLGKIARGKYRSVLESLMLNLICSALAWAHSISTALGKRVWIEVFSLSLHSIHSSPWCTGNGCLLAVNAAPEMLYLNDIGILFLLVLGF